jgi:pimeloyl-ACP methyl ester carboxylesterase
MLGLMATWSAAALAADFYACVDARTAPVLNGSQCASELLPLSYAAAQLEGMDSVTLFLRRFPATTNAARGTVWLVADGPGESGASLYPALATVRRSFPGFDIVVPDARGTGLSSRLCPEEEAMDSPGGGALVGAEAASCAKRLNGAHELVAQYGFANAARDLRYLVRQEASNKPVYLVGVGYGARVVLRALALGKLPATGIVLDAPPPATGAWAPAPASGLNLPQSPASAPLAAIILASENAPAGAPSTPSTATEPAQAWPTYARESAGAALPPQMPPLLVLAGADAADRIAQLRALPGSRVTVVSVPGAPRAVVQTAPGCFERAVKAFVAGAGGADIRCADSR